MLVDGISLAEGSSDHVIGLAKDRIVTQPGTLAQVQGTNRWTVLNKIRLLRVVARVAQAPTGRDLTLVIKKNGVSITSSPITITQGTNTVTLSSDQLLHKTAEVEDYYTMDVLNVGSVVAGSDLSVQINYVETL